MSDHKFNELESTCKRRIDLATQLDDKASIAESLLFLNLTYDLQDKNADEQAVQTQLQHLDSASLAPELAQRIKAASNEFQRKLKRLATGRWEAASTTLGGAPGAQRAPSDSKAARHAADIAEMDDAVQHLVGHLFTADDHTGGSLEFVSAEAVDIRSDYSFIDGSGVSAETFGGHWSIFRNEVGCPELRVEALVDGRNSSSEYLIEIKGDKIGLLGSGSHGTLPSLVSCKRDW